MRYFHPQLSIIDTVVKPVVDIVNNQPWSATAIRPGVHPGLYSTTRPSGHPAVRPGIHPTRPIIRPPSISSSLTKQHSLDEMDAMMIASNLLRIASPLQELLMLL